MSRSSPPRVSLRDAEASLEADSGVVPLPTTVTEALVAGIEFGRGKLLPGAGSTAELFETLATLAAHDLGAARTIEPHLDAIAIMDQCGGVDMPGGTDGLSWGVFAAEGGDEPLQYADGLLSGVKPWCSLAARLDRALVTARNADGSRQLFAVNLGHRGVHVQANGWHARGLTEIPSGPVRFDAVPATAVGAPGWYLDRPGFAWGGMAVAACWYGGSLGVARTVFAAALSRATDPLTTMHLGAVDEAVSSARRALVEAAALIDAGSATGVNGSVLAKRVRSTVALAGERILAHAGHALGPAPLALNAQHAKRVADLTLYLRQHHAERDDASLGARLLAAGDLPW